MRRRYLIIGNGPAGYKAARAIRERDRTGQIIIYSAERYDFYSRPGLAYLLTATVPEAQLFPHKDDHYRQMGILLVNKRVTSLDPINHRIHLENGESPVYDSLLLATGARAILPELPGIDSQGVVTFDSLTDTKQILKLSRKAKEAVVIGGGITALELVEGFIKQNVKVHYFLRGDRFWPRIFEPEESRLVENHLTDLGVKIHHHTEINSIINHKGRVAAVETQDNKTIKCQIVGAAIGVRPRIELAKQIGLATQRGILVDEYLRTSDPSIFAAGDVAEIYDPERETHVVHSLWSIARNTGEVAGCNMAGEYMPFRNPIASNTSMLVGIPVTIIGAVGSGEQGGDIVSIVRGDSENWQAQLDAFAVEAKYQATHLRLMVGRTHLLGAVLIGDQRTSSLVQMMIENRINILPIRERLFQAGTDVIGLLQAYWDQYRRQKRAG